MFEGGSSSDVVVNRFSCCSRSLLITLLLNLSSCLFGSHRSPSLAPTTKLVANTSLGVPGIEGGSTFGLLVVSVELGSGVSPSFCLTYV
jgi:hypothetical protein